MRQNRRRTRGRRSDADKIKYIRMAAIPLAVVIVLVIIIMVMDKKPGDKETAATPGTGVSAESGPSGGDISISGDGTEAQDAGVEPDNSQYTTDFPIMSFRRTRFPRLTC